MSAASLGPTGGPGAQPPPPPPPGVVPPPPSVATGSEASAPPNAVAATARPGVGGGGGQTGHVAGAVNPMALKVNQEVLTSLHLIKQQVWQELTQSK